jgi:uncharacterized membrane protein YhiD involved in acid resistance
MVDFFTLHSVSSNPTLVSLVYTALLAAVLSGLVAWVYEKTFHGLSYSRNYVQALVLSSMVAATIMQAIGDSIARGLGMMGALAIVRFRTNFKDPKDLIFLFAAIAAGIASGVYAWGVAMGGTLAFCIVAAILYKADIGSHRAYDGLLRFTVGDTQGAGNRMEVVFKEHLRHFALVSLREIAGGKSLDYSYQIKLKQGHKAEDLLGDLSKIETLAGLHFMMQESTTEL